MSHEAGIDGVRRLTLRAAVVQGLDDLVEPADHVVPDAVATEAVSRLRRRNRVLLLIGLLLLAGFVAAVNLFDGRDYAGWVGYVISALFVAACLALPGGAIGFVRWTRREGALRGGRWRRGHVEVHPDRPRVHRVRVFDGLGPTVEVVLSRTVVREIPPEFRTGEVLLGGRGDHLTVVFTRGPVLAAARPAQLGS